MAAHIELERKKSETPEPEKRPKRLEMEIKNLVKRVSGTGDFITYDPAKCVSCGACSLICPMNLWGTKAGKAFLVPDYQDKCLECGSCWLVCQSNAIDFSYPKAGTGVIWEYG